MRELNNCKQGKFGKIVPVRKAIDRISFMADQIPPDQFEKPGAVGC